jgi:dUTP pyrophosphatase
MFITTPTVKFRKTRTNAAVPRKNEGDAGYDLTITESRTVKAGERALLPTGISLEIPRGLYGHISDRSSMAWKKGLHCMGKIIDSTYRGEVGVVVLNTSNQDVTLEEGDRVAQIIFKHYYDVCLEEVDELEETQRGSGGFGSTGK